MLPIQELEIITKNQRLFSVHLEKWAQSHFECKLAAINLDPQPPADAIFNPFSKGKTALAAYKALVAKLRSELVKLDSTDAIAVVNNPCGTEFVTANEQQQILGQGIVVKANEINA